ncbi:MAG TPA: zf-HC2 domain-containing protein [Thermoanaerobaculia bacterium]|nr:zf-HC2 domain-containing protein [Thermoanaerobaculia bacterium]
MSKNPPLFDESLLSGYLDGELTQAESQRVRLHLETDPEARRIFDDLSRMRQAARGTRFRLPDDRQWDERPKHSGSRLARDAGWLLLAIWLVATTGFGLYHLAVSPEGLWLKLTIFAPLSGIALLFGSTVLDRLKTLPTDRYRRVEK